MRNLLKFVLKILSKRVINRYQPVVVGVTGSVGKSTTKEAIFSVLSSKYWVRKSEENYNNEFGVPMTILGIEASKFQDFSYKLKSLNHSLWLAYGWPKSDYPNMLVLEIAADRPGDIEYLVRLAKPQIGVVTAIGEVPVHVEFYANPETLAKEKAKLVEALPAHDGLAVLNYDDQTVLDMAGGAKAKIITFGFSKKADVWASDISYFASEKEEAIGGLSFKINHAGTFVPIRVNNLIGSHQIYGILAAVAVGLKLDMNLVDISGAFEHLELPHQRMVLGVGIKNSVIIDDSYNASPLSTHAALDTLRDFSLAMKKIGHKPRRVAILGDMRELGKYEVEAHRAIGNFAAERCDVLVTVGSAGKLIADSAANQMKPERIISFNTADEAKSGIKEIIKEDDVVLVKGSRSMQMEKIVQELLVTQ
jgi:UDP-N-acetylmuramoyl-tripeptide--D-alanyl-D-alanine ligase